MLFVLLWAACVAQRYYHGLQRLRTGLTLSTSGTSLVGNCKGRCQQPILMICVPKCIQRGITFLRQPLITPLIAAKVFKRVDFCAWRSYSNLNKSRCFVYYVSSFFLSFAYYYHVYPSCDFHHSKTFPSWCCNFNVEECNIHRWPASLSIDHIHLWANCNKYIPGSQGLFTV